MSAKKSQGVVICTKYRGVFFGYIANDKKLPAEITLTGVRNCIYWSANVGGFQGLVSKGPNRDCKIGERVPEATLYEITYVAPATDVAIENWEQA